MKINYQAMKIYNQALKINYQGLIIIIYAVLECFFGAPKVFHPV